MGCLSAKTEITNGAKYNKNHRKRKMFSLGIGIEGGDITMSAHTQIGYVSAMVKKYDKQNDESTTETDVDMPDQLPIDPDNG
jgi:predicted HNH restriction endonuclease